MSIELTKKQLKFCECYAYLDSPTYGKKSASCVAAGYSDKNPSQCAYNLLQNPKVIEWLNTIYGKNVNKHKGRIISTFEYHRLKALEDNKFEAANNALKFEAQILGFLRPDDSPSQEKEKIELDETQKKEIKEYVKWRHLKMLSGSKSDQGSKDTELIEQGGEILEDVERSTEMSYESRSNDE